MIYGLKGTSLIDYPGRVAVVLYTKGCNFRCPFCHNQALVLEKDLEPIPQAKVLELLGTRRGFIDGVVITGGEPTVNKKLYNLVATLKTMKFAVKLDTNGYNPGVLRTLFAFGVVDFVAMDIKTTWPKYSLATGMNVDINRLIESIALIKTSGVDYEFRTTCVPSLVDGEDIEEISKLVGRSGHLTLQQFQPENTLDPDYKQVTPYPREVLVDFLEIANRNTASCRLIGLQ